MSDEFITIDWEKINTLSYKTQLGKSLKNTLRKFDKEELFEELNSIITYFTDTITEEAFPYSNRIKSLQSCSLKYDKYYPSTEVEKVFNDLLGIRIIVEDYSIVDNIPIPKNVRLVDLREGKTNDDGYRAIHMYFQKDHDHYPIEVQFMTSKDRQFNEWLHMYFYKYVADIKIGCHLRRLYDEGVIQNEAQFRKELAKCAT